MRISNKLCIASFLSLSLFQNLAIALECSAKSGATTVPLFELYTSEGCSSCPPADKCLSGQKFDSSKFTPLAFHVDYWNYIGWKDPFSKAQYSERQRKIAAFSGAGFVYTPQFVMNGRDFKGWDNSRLNQSVAASKALASRANLTLNTMQENGKLTLNASAQSVNASDAKNADVFVAIYENKLSSKINAGENSGRELKHDYVVREFFGAYQINNQKPFSKSFTLDSSWAKRNAGAVVFVQNSQTGEILQSLALKFCNGEIVP